jgi:hypothetical protein
VKSRCGLLGRLLVFEIPWAYTVALGYACEMVIFHRKSCVLPISDTSSATHRTIESPPLFRKSKLFFLTLPSVKKTDEGPTLDFLVASSMRIQRLASLRPCSHVDINEKIGILQSSLLLRGDLDELSRVRRCASCWCDIGEFLKIGLLFPRQLEQTSVIGRYSPLDVCFPLLCCISRAFQSSRR